MACTYALGLVERGILGFLAISGAFASLIGVALQRLGRSKNRSQKRLGIGAFLFFVGFGIVLGAILSAAPNRLYVIGVFGMLGCAMLLVFLLEVWVSKTQERMRVVVEGSYSLDFVRLVTRMIENALSNGRLPYKKYGNRFQLDLAGKERIIIALDADFVGRSTEYLLVLRTSGSKTSPVFVDLRREIYGKVGDLDRHGGIESCKKVESIVCKDCQGKASYIVASDEFFCRRCRKMKIEKDLTITYEKESA